MDNMKDNNAKVVYFKAPDGWTTDSPNPFSTDGTYGPKWTCFCIQESDEHFIYSGKGENGLYLLSVSTQVGDIKERLADFLRYEGSFGRNVIVLFSEGWNVDSLVRDALDTTPDPGVLRESDPKWVVHSTTVDAWNQIRRDQRLRSLSALRDDQKELDAFTGFDNLGEPPEYADFIVFGAMESASPEIVLSCKQKRAIRVDADVAYSPGARLYFDNHRIISSGLGVRDGAHLIKVRGTLPLRGFHKATITLSDLEDNVSNIEWTPRIFTEEANKLFMNRLS